MIKKAILLFFLCFLMFSAAVNVCADERTGNIEIYLVLDKSLSMVEEIESVKQYVREEILDKILKTGDYFLLIPFYGKTDASFSGFVDSADSLRQLESDVSEIEADGRFTDIGNALDKLKNSINMEGESSHRYMLLITDGKQEAPPESRYYSPDGTFNHSFLENTKEIQKEGWKVVVLGIGTENSARELAQSLSAGYTEVQRGTGSSEISEAVGDFLGRLEITSFPETIKADSKGVGKLEFEVNSSGYSSDQTAVVEEIQLVSPMGKVLNITGKPVSIKIAPESTETVSIDLNLPEVEEGYNGELVFIFSGEGSLTPAVHSVNILPPSTFRMYLLYIPLILIMLIIIFFVNRIIRRKKMEDEDNKPNGAT